MPRPKNPNELARITGADRKNPQRYSDRSDPTVAAVGEPPARLSAAEQGEWYELAGDLPWLRRSDRRMLELCCRLTSRMHRDPDMGINALAQLRLCLSALGATPVDRNKVSAGREAHDPANEFIN